jgi:hypothetical protein
VSVGSFYFIMHPLMYYYCAAIQGDEMRLYLIESFQCGEKITAAMRADINHSPYYIPVTDKKILNRLKRRLDEFLKARPAERAMTDWRSY